MVFLLFVSFVILSRIAELIVTRSNERWLLQHGAVEYGKKHYPFMIVLHSAFFVALIAEYLYRTPSLFSPVLLVFFFTLFALKASVVASLGRYWCTKIYRIPHAPLIKKGLYKYFKHPNYMIVVAEIAVIPLIFNLYCTALVFSVLNAIMLTVRIKEENKALGN